MIVPFIDRRRRALEHVQLAASVREVWHTLNSRRAGANDAHSLVAEFIHEGALVVATGVVVVPSTRVEGVAVEIRDTVKTG